MKPVKIIENLYLGNAKTSRDLTLLRSNEIKAIVCLAGKICFPSDFTYLEIHIPDNDEAEIKEQLEQSSTFIHEQIQKGNKVLVHCQGAVSRSPAFVIAYLSRYQLVTVNEATQIVQKARPAIRPRPKFIEEIRTWLGE